MTDALKGGLAGFAATLPMTSVMDRLFFRLPPEERYPLPPREITKNAVGKAALWRRLDEPEKKALTLLGHYSYGAVMGAFFAKVLAHKYRANNLMGGAGFGFLVWLVSYGGYLPLVGLFRPAKDEPARRSGLMIAAHLVWGASLVSILRLLRLSASGGLRTTAQSFGSPSTFAS